MGCTAITKIQPEPWSIDASHAIGENAKWGAPSQNWMSTNYFSHTSRKFNFVREDGKTSGVESFISGIKLSNFQFGPAGA